ncbi:unnamed protein product, partial [Musa acuminata subsp. burmannicoides]
SLFFFFLFLVHSFRAMVPTAKPNLVRNLIVRALLFFASMFLLRFVYVVTVYGGSCTAGDYCLFSPLAEPLTVAGTTGGASASAAVASAHAGDGSSATPAVRALWTSREWRKAVDFYSAVFQDLVAEGFLSPASKSLCVDAPAGYEVLSLKEIGVAGAIGVARKSAPPLVVAGGNLLHLPFKNGTFDFVFAGQSLDRSKQPADLAAEIARTLRPHWFLVVLTASGGDAYSLHALAKLFPGCVAVRSREINSPDSSKSLREIVFQKEDGTHIVSADGNSDSKCPIPEHKLQILQSAEPLIEEEPLKPWITFKRNIQNVKYLPSIADISFKQRYIYVDVGARSYGSSIGSWFRKRYPKQNHTFEIYAIEADRAFHKEYATKKGVNLLPYAAWVCNETLTFEINHDPDNHDVGKGRGMGRIRPTGGSNGRVTSDDVHPIQGLDFAAWLKKTATERDYVVMKMDVEGTEFDLVPRLFKTGAICLIDELFLECHYNRWQKCCPGQRSPKYPNTYRECLNLFTSLRNAGVLVHQMIIKKSSLSLSLLSSRDFFCCSTSIKFDLFPRATFFADSLQVRPPYPDPAAPMATMARLLLLREDLCRACVLGMLLPLVVAALLLVGQRRGGDEEVDVAPLQLRLGRDDQDPADHALRAAWLAEDVVGVGRQDLPGGDMAAVLLHLATQVHHANHVEGAARQDARQATPKAVAHLYHLSLL